MGFACDEVERETCLLSLKICDIRFTSTRKAERKGENVRSIAFMDFLWNNLVVISERMKRMTACFAEEKFKSKARRIVEDQKCWLIVIAFSQK